MSRPPTRLIAAAVGVVLVAIGAVALLTQSSKSTPQPTAASAHMPRAPAQSRSRAIPAKGPVVLGAKSFIVWGGLGFGTAHPSKLVVGSDPSVMITGIRWHGWGRRTASGVGRYSVPHFGHGGDYYRKKFRADLRVSGIGTCRANGPRTYMALKVRVALQPGQRPSWYEADGSHGLCSYP
jgi:hypothetical protein